ncbi:uncharacterized protein LOC127242900 [Andrographis paniculata]|uniref:uncharacterized protein LOC127242900 n=1 Tax=Andrographis paniculata TaxID=175694 RepID=UPI0021E81541|nr:uncharacterized protein LOC127242900 [Andrographis paniculata]
MGWSYPRISLQELIKLITNFIDMLVLASGYQSTGRPAHWDSHNIRRSFQWALFLQKVLKDLTSSIDYEESVKELDAALLELKSNPRFPQGLLHISCGTLVKARDLLLEHLIQTLPLRESHLKAIMLSCVEMDLIELQGLGDDDCVVAYVDKLTRASQDLDLNGDRRVNQGSEISILNGGRPCDLVNGEFSVSAIQKLRRRQLAAAACSSVVDNGLECLWNTLRLSVQDEFGSASCSKLTKQTECQIVEELPVELVVSNHWRSRSLLYMLHRRTMRLVSSASLIFSVPDDQWAQVFNQLKASPECDDSCEIIEIILLGCIADRWSTLIQHLMSVSYESIPVSRLYKEMLNIRQGKALNFGLKEGFINPKEKSAVNFLESLFSNDLSQLWKLPPILAAVAIPSWSHLFTSYLREIEGQFYGSSLPTKCCGCPADQIEHRECEVAERLWCLYIFHVCRSRRTTGA